MGFRENKFKRVLSKSYKTDPNKIKISAAVTPEHEILKSIVSTLLIKNKHEIITEAIFETGGRADIYDLSTGVVYEILHTETYNYFISKLDRYPQEIVEIIPIHTKHYKDMTIEQITTTLNKILY